MKRQYVHGGDVYRNDVRLDFSVNLDPVPMPEVIRQAMLDGIAWIHHYPDHDQQLLREKIARLEGVHPGQVVCGNGASELIMSAVHAAARKKSQTAVPIVKSLITAPCYAGYARALGAADAEIIEYHLDEADGFALGRGFIDMITDDIDIVFITDPNNPNGRLIDPEIKMEIVQACSMRGIVLVIDECFYPLTRPGAREYGDRRTDRNDAQMCDCGKPDRIRRPGYECSRAGLSGGCCPDVYAADGLLRLRAFTKTFAIPGVRIGYMISHDEILLGEIRRQLPEWNISGIAERTGEAAADILLDTDYLAQSVRMIDEERIYLEGQLTELGLKVYPSDTNYLMFQYPNGKNADLYDSMLERGILIRKCSNFSGLGSSYYRIAVRTHEDNEELVSTLREVIDNGYD